MCNPMIERLEHRALLSAGALDTSFGSKGRIQSNFPQSEVEALAQQSDGRLVVAGEVFARTGGEQAYLARYRTDGHLDTSFGIAGRVYTNLPKNSFYFPSQLLVTPDNKILLLLSRSNSSLKGDLLLRYLPSGKLDTSFGDHGIATIAASP